MHEQIWIVPYLYNCSNGIPSCAEYAIDGVCIIIGNIGNQRLNRWFIDLIFHNTPAEILMNQFKYHVMI